MLKSLLPLLASMALFACQGPDGQKNYLFDMGSAALPTDPGYVKVTPAKLYDSATGYGWIKAPDSIFFTGNQKIPLTLVHDGVSAPDSMVFRADIRNGDYMINITTGTHDSIPTNIRINVNGTILFDSVTTPWYRLSYRTSSSRISIRDGKLLVTIAGIGTTAGLQGIEVRAITGPYKKIEEPGKLGHDTTTVRELEKELQASLQQHPGNAAIENQLGSVRNYLLACRYYDFGGWSWGVKQTGLSLIYRSYIVADLLQPMVNNPDDPLYYPSLYLQGKVFYWLNQEDDDPSHERRFADCFKKLQPAFPDNDLLKMYMGARIPFETKMGPADPSAPQWAQLQREAMSRMLQVIYWWVNERQTDNGELGGKYGDDVEILRWWLPAILGADDSIARKGYLRLANGVWNSGVLENGFAKRIDDVEHSAELFSDTHPALLLMEYGDPEYVERCMTSMQNFRDTWTGITPKGHRHFKSCYLSATQVLPQPPFGVDVPLNARACRPGLWAAWYNSNPSIVQLLTQWCQSWAADAARTEKGKPAGLLPAAISFANDGIGGYSGNWFDPQLPYDYYNWESTGHINELQYQMLAMYKVTGDQRLLIPLRAAATLMKDNRLPDPHQKNIPGTQEWARDKLVNDEGVNSTAKLFSLAKRISGTHEFDSLILQFGQSYNKYGITGQRDSLLQGFNRLLEGLRYNFPMLTSEVKFTDRVYAPGSNLLAGMYTGHFSFGYEYPSMVASWKNTGKDVAIFVHRGDQRSARISLYNFGETKTVTMNSWQLEPGEYTIRIGIDSNDDSAADEPLHENTFTIKERVNAVPIELPSKKNIVVDILQRSAGNPLPARAADLAIHERDIQVKVSPDKMETNIEFKVHNIGNLPAKNVKAGIWIDDQPAGNVMIDQLEAPNDLRPRWTILTTKTIKAPFKSGVTDHKLEIRLQYDGPEITTLNNSAVIKFRISR